MTLALSLVLAVSAAAAPAPKAEKLPPGVAELRAGYDAYLQGDFVMARAKAEEALKIPTTAVVDARVLAAAALIRAGKAKEALPDLDALVAGSPTNAFLLYVRAAAKSRAGDDAGSASDAEAAAKIDPVVENVAGCDWRLAAGTRSDLQKACHPSVSFGSECPRIGACTSLIETAGLTGEDLASAYCDRGAAFSAGGRLDAAVSDYGRALEAQPSSRRALWGRALARHQWGKEAEAIVDLDAVLASSKDDPSAFGLRGEANAALKRWGKAVADYDEALTLQPGEPEYLHGRGRAKLGKGDLDGALADFKACVDAGDDFGACGVGVGVAWSFKGDARKAVAAFDACLKQNGRNMEAKVGRSRAKRALGDAAGAKADEAAALKQNGDALKEYDKSWGSLRPAGKR